MTDPQLRQTERTTDQAATQAAVRERVLDQAEELFRRYGYGKTTMADIARSVDMSAANLYRYFDAKEEIAVLMSQRCMYQDEDAGRAVIRTAEPSAAKKLSALIRTVALQKYDRFRDDPYLHEIIQICALNRRETMDMHMASCVALIQEVLDQGRASGEFEPIEGDGSGDAFKVLLTLAGAWYPIVSALFTREQIQDYCGQISQLLLKGLLARRPG